ncbi:hypothetical protein DOTSEDRAFT_49408 [Dothistroma septosporum NZE10]|uniref:Thioesterase domain-containing protein n=1 Tax=Dothistroma septosporum (strain NZE10 / CBS 128990) TaxID=675120 RepID=N1Q1D7_DOTSN|nr:hypothetical protein DOTSEDRAFT_49408 [Dothistroma septosporum NZE10]
MLRLQHNSRFRTIATWCMTLANAALFRWNSLLHHDHAYHLRITAGGAVAILFDGLTTSTMAIIARKGFWEGSEVTRKLEVTYHRPIPIEEESLLSATLWVLAAASRKLLLACDVRATQPACLLRARQDLSGSSQAVNESRPKTCGKLS